MLHVKHFVVASAPTHKEAWAVVASGGLAFAAGGAFDRAMTTAAKKRPPPRVVHLRLDLGAGVRLGPGRVDLLQAIADEGSIRAAGRNLGMSVKKTAQLVDVLNRSFREPLIAASKGGQGGGGGAALTSLGREVLAQYRRAEQAAVTAAADEIAALQAAVRGQSS